MTIGKSVEDSRVVDECPRCGYGPLGAYVKARRLKCPACFYRLVEKPGREVR